MNKQVLIGLALCAVASGSSFAAGKKGGAPNQAQPTGSVVTTMSLAAAVGSATSRSITIVGVTSTGGIQLNIQATSSTGASITVPAVASLSGSTVTVSFSDGSSTTFSLGELG